MEFYLPIIWLIIAIIMGIIEMSTSQLISVWFVLGALSASGTSLFCDDILIQVIVFVAVSVLALIITKPFINKIKKVPEYSTNIDAKIGKVFTVISEIDENMGEIKIDDVIWRVKKYDESKVLKGEKVLIESVDGTKLIVTHHQNTN